MLDYPTPAIASRVKTTRMSGFLAWHHCTGRVPAQVLAERMRANLPSGAPGTDAGKSFPAQSVSRLLQLLNTQLVDYDDAIAAAVAEHPDSAIFATFPGVGPVLTGVLLAEIGEDRSRFPSTAARLTRTQRGVGRVSPTRNPSKMSHDRLT